jgi:hypothetical protein
MLIEIMLVVLLLSVALTLSGKLARSTFEHTNHVQDATDRTIRRQPLLSQLRDDVWAARFPAVSADPDARGNHLLLTYGDERTIEWRLDPEAGLATRSVEREGEVVVRRNYILGAPARFQIDPPVTVWLRFDTTASNQPAACVDRRFVSGLTLVEEMSDE